MSGDLLNSVKEAYHKMFGGEPIVVNSPGRINLLGEHIDYNGGTVLPAAIDRSIVMAISLNRMNHLALFSIDYNEERTISLEDPRPKGDWSDYITGVSLQFLKHLGRKEGFNMVFCGDIPIGSGLSSSAALECGVAIALNKLFGTDLSLRELALLSQAAENQFVGVQCGLMDQYASLFGKENTVIQLDCRSHSHKYHQLDFGAHELILCDSGVTHSLAGHNGYNDRRKECASGLADVQKNHPEVAFLTDVAPEMLNLVKPEMDEILFKRCSYVINEHRRVMEATLAVQQNDLDYLGRLMYETHQGLRDEFEVSNPELDFLVTQTKAENHVLGARMVGGGFGGCTLNLVQKGNLSYFRDTLKDSYKQAFGLDLKVYQVSISRGGHLIV